MTRRAAGAGMFCMIEPHIESLQRGKRPHLSALRVRVADGTELARLVRELLLVTSGARRVRVFAGQNRLGGIVLAAMTEQTWQARVLCIVVFELRVICLRREPSLGPGRKNNQRHEE